METVKCNCKDSRVLALLKARVSNEIQISTRKGFGGLTYGWPGAMKSVICMINELEMLMEEEKEKGKPVEGQIHCEECTKGCSVQDIYFFGRPQDGVHLCQDCFIDFCEEAQSMILTKITVRFPNINQPHKAK